MKTPILLALFLLTANVDYAISLDSSLEESRVKLVGHVPTKAIANTIRKEDIDPETAVAFTFVLPLRNQQELEALVEQIYNPANKEYYRKYLTQEEFIDRFCPTQQDYDKVVDYAKQSGLDVVGLHPNRTLVQVAGSAKSVEAAFAVKLNVYQQENGTAFYAPSDDPAVHSEMVSIVGGVIGLDNALTQKPLAPPAKKRKIPTPTVLPAVQFPSGHGGGLSPADIKRAYNLTGVLQDGEGQKIAIFSPASYRLSDITTYTNYFHLPTPHVVDVIVDGGPTEESSEVALDIELALALAPASQIYVYQGPNTASSILNIYNRIATDNIAKQVSTSWGWAENYAGLAILRAEYAIFLQMAAQGQTVYAASGDKGAYENAPYAQDLEVSDPASQPYVVAVGGTSLTIDPTTGSYVSETVWNRGMGNGAGGGGISEVWKIPTWQQNISTVRSTTYRNIPDVALNADQYKGYDICYGGRWYMFGGTSCAAPLWAAFNALVNQKRQATFLPPLGFASPLLYNIGKVSTAATSIYHDITTGNNLFFPATTGYDNATGWGSFNGAQLLNLLSGEISINITSPANNTTVGGTINFTASAGNSAGIARVDFYTDSNLIGTRTTAPYAISLNTTGLSAGSHTLKAIAYNALSESAQSTVNITVSNSTPAISFATLKNNAVVSGLITIQANASDSSGISGVDFYIDNTSIGTVTKAPYTITFNTQRVVNGLHTLKVVARNPLGNTAQAVDSMTVQNPLPQVSFSKPMHGATVRGAISIEANAYDSIGIQRVDFYVDSKFISSIQRAPYRTALSTSKLSKGAHTLKAVAYNLSGNFSETLININVK